MKPMDKPLKAEAVATVSRTREIMKRYGITTKKSLGQNFLIDQNILNKIVSAAELNPAKGALEIGPGIGALTEKLAQTAGKVVAVEIDQRLLSVLSQVLEPYPNASVIHGDILRTDLHALWLEQFSQSEAVSVVANLPYYITTPIIMSVLESGVDFEHMVVMIQKEVADRMAAAPGSKAYGSLSVAVQYYCSISTVASVPHTVFIPQPNVDSAVIRLTRRAEPAVQVEDEAFFFEVVQASFVQRRKTLYNNLASKFGKEHKEELLQALEQEGIDPSRRGETLSLAEYAALAKALAKFHSS